MTLQRFFLVVVGVLAKLLVSLSLTALLVPIGAIVFLLNWLARSALRLYLRFRYGGRIQLVSRSGDAMFGFTSPGNTRNMLVALRVKKMIDPAYCRNAFQKNVMEYRRGNSYPYAKLQRIFRRDLYPYFCWEIATNFNLENHVQVLEDSKVYTLPDLCSLLSELRKDMSEEHPQWQFLLIPRFGNGEEETDSCIIARVHHSYCDGLSFVNLVSHAIGALDPSVDAHHVEVSMEAEDHEAPPMKPNPASYPYVVNPMTFSIPWRYRAIYNVNCLLFGAYHLLATLCSSLTSDGHFVPRETYPGASGKFYDACQDVGWERVKGIRSRCKVSVESIVGTCFLAALEHVVPQRLPKCRGKVGHTLAILPYPDETFHNRFTMMSVPFERKETGGGSGGDGDVAERLERLKEYQKQTKKAITGPEYYLYFWFFQFYGQLPGFLLKYVLREARFTFSMANLPFAKKRLLLFNSQVLSVIGWPPYTTDAGLGITLVGYDEKLSIGVTADSSWLSKDELGRILARFLQEVEYLEKACLTTSID